jgi:hypothetical protein
MEGFEKNNIDGTGSHIDTKSTTSAMGRDEHAKCSRECTCATENDLESASCVSHPYALVGNNLLVA